MTRPGRPSVLGPRTSSPQIAELRGEGLGYGTIAERVGVGRTTVRRVLGKSGFRLPCLNSSEGEGRTRRLA